MNRKARQILTPARESVNSGVVPLGASSGEDDSTITDGVVRMKGIGFANVHHYVLTKHGQSAWQKVLESLAAPDRREVESSVAVGWYSTQLFGRLLRAVDRICGDGDLRILRDVGAFEADLDTHRSLRFLIRILHPSAIFTAERRLWSHFHDSGQWTFKSIPKGMDGRLDGWAVDLALCTELSGYLVRMVEFTGGKQVTVDHPECRGTGAASCLYQFRWQ